MSHSLIIHSLTPITISHPCPTLPSYAVLPQLQSLAIHIYPNPNTSSYTALHKPYRLIIQSLVEITVSHHTKPCHVAMYDHIQLYPCPTSHHAQFYSVPSLYSQPYASSSLESYMALAKSYPLTIQHLTHAGLSPYTTSPKLSLSPYTTLHAQALVSRHTQTYPSHTLSPYTSLPTPVPLQHHAYTALPIPPVSHHTQPSINPSHNTQSCPKHASLTIYMQPHPNPSLSPFMALSKPQSPTIHNLPHVNSRCTRSYPSARL